MTKRNVRRKWGRKDCRGMATPVVLYCKLEPVNSWRASYSILSRLARLWRPHSIWILTGSFEEPPFEYGIMWSKWSPEVEQHLTQRPLSRFHTSSFTQLGISRSSSTTV